MESGFDGYMPKPINARQFLQLPDHPRHEADDNHILE